ncbi:hypothetical protein Dsin_020284 [Dipteronia sinensis]|uniref:RNase H type-1 domain-containing protein n=1 Tax=Dipteronia sinensis TaxID=43782 RepID=A0AAE0AA53_9ROSI|nr:hypothetical protein Dsin_020284 [Dipteronia sinensis]
MAATAHRDVANYTPKAEALVILKGITFAIESGLLPVVIKSDMLEVVNNINLGNNFSLDVGSILLDIRDLLQSYASCCVVYVSRKANVVAHNLSKINLSIEEDCHWIETDSPYMERFVRNDCPV